MEKEITAEELNFLTEDNCKLNGWIYHPQASSKGLVVVCHGMAEHIARYDSFMNFLAANGYLCYGYDQRGHGKTAGAIANLGYMSAKDNFMALVYDLHQVILKLKDLYPKLNIYLFGHSMGSFVSERYAELYSDTIKGVILSGSSYNTGPLYALGHLLATIITNAKGRRYVSSLIDKLSFRSYNKKFQPAKTPFDWLSRNERNNQKYVADPYCGTVFSVSFFKDLTRGFRIIARDIKKIASDLPIYIVSGAMDPVGRFGKGTTKLYQKLLAKGLKDVSLKLYPGARHEILNETNKAEVEQDILSWLRKR